MSNKKPKTPEPVRPDHPADLTGDDALLPLADRVEIAARK